MESVIAVPRENSIEAAARCPRCGGLMVAEPCTDFWADAENVAMRRCVQCGEVIDPIILLNRRRTP
jgi:hypothetical protein